MLVKFKDEMDYDVFIDPTCISSISMQSFPRLVIITLKGGGDNYFKVKGTIEEVAHAIEDGLSRSSL